MNSTLASCSFLQLLVTVLMISQALSRPFVGDPQGVQILGDVANCNGLHPQLLCEPVRIFDTMINKSPLRLVGGFQKMPRAIWKQDANRFQIRPNLVFHCSRNRAKDIAGVLWKYNMTVVVWKNINKIYIAHCKKWLLSVLEPGRHLKDFA